MAANFKYVYQVTEYFRKIVDESDNTFMSDADAAQYLEVAYDEFRFFVSDVDPNQYHKVVTTPVITLNEFDLAVVSLPFNPILGSLAADADRMQQMVRVTTVAQGTTPPVGTIYEPVYSYESLISPGYTWPNKYLLQGTKLLFQQVPSAALRIEYIPQSVVDWTNLNQTVPPAPPPNAEWIDDMIQFHDVIALMAAKSYMMVDGAGSSQIERQLTQRGNQLKEFLTRGRLVPANRYVASDSPYQVF